MSVVSVPVYASSTVLAAPTIIDATLTPLSTFSINITIADVEKMWGYQFFIYYNTNVLTATDYYSYPPFTFEAVTQINDTAGWIFLSYVMPFGETVGFSTVDPAPIAWVEFTVDSLGTSALHLDETLLPSVPIDGDPIMIAHDIIDGYFSNSAEYIDLLADYVALNATYHSLLAEFNELTNKYNSLQANHTDLQGDINSLQTSYNSLNQTYNTLQSEYDGLKSNNDALTENLETVRILSYIFIITTVFFIATTVYSAVRKPKPKQVS